MQLIIIYYNYYHLNHLFPDLKGTVPVRCYPPPPPLPPYKKPNKLLGKVTPLFKEGKHVTVMEKTDKLVTACLITMETLL